MALNEFEQKMYNRISSAVGGSQRVVTYYNSEENGDKKLDILVAEDSPTQNLATVATLGAVNNFPKYEAPNGENLRVEFFSITYQKYVWDFSRMLTGIALMARNDESTPYSLGSMITNVIEKFFPDCNSDMKHIVFALPPDCWGEEKLDMLKLDDDNILTWLWAVPISEKEKIYLEKEGTARLGKLLPDIMNKGLDIFDVNRNSLI